ncbi:MAG TPA: 3'-5' exonuclease, partial [Terriglobales bacterium]|nr:3'-5' exonuclease [Terriglobales bacterium]
GDRITVTRLEDDLEEARYLATEIDRLRRNGTSPRDIAVFYRANAQSRSVEEMLVRHRIPYAIFGGVKFYARAEVKDVLAYLRVLLNPADSLSAKRIVNLPARGIGSVTVDKIAALDEEAGGFLPACRLALERGALPNQAAEKVRTFVALIDALHQELPRAKPAEMAAKVIEMTGYGPMLRDDPSSEAQDRLQNLDELLKAMQEAGDCGQTLPEYLEQIALVTDLDAYDSRSERVTLMTLHSAKGLEFPFVFMTALEENIFPHSRSGNDDHELEEERRLCYVGITRAMKKLYMTHARRRRSFGESVTNDRSRFIDEIPPELLHELDLAEDPQPSWSSPPRGGRPYRPQRPVARPAPAEVRVVYEQPEDGLRVGARVRHATFGLGVIKDVEGSGDNRKATILFQGAGIKKVMLRFAGLEPA